MEFAEGVEGKEDKDGPRDAEMLGTWYFGTSRIFMRRKEYEKINGARIQSLKGAFFLRGYPP